MNTAEIIRLTNPTAPHDLLGSVADQRGTRFSPQRQSHDTAPIPQRAVLCPGDRTEQPMTDPRIRLLFTRAQLIGMGRCPDCGWHPKTQGHHPHCQGAA